MSPQSFRPLIDAESRGRAMGKGAGWVPDPLLGPSDPGATDAARGGGRGESFSLSEATGSPSDEAPGAGSDAPPEALSARFEQLDMERLTGEPVRESLPMGLGDGLEFEPEPAPEGWTADAVRAGDPPAVAADDPVDSVGAVGHLGADAAADRAIAQPTGGHSLDGLVDDARSDAASDGSPAGPAEAFRAPEDGKDLEVTHDSSLSAAMAAFMQSQGPVIAESEHQRLLDEAVAAEREVAFAAGLAQGIAQGLDDGLAKGDAQAREALKAELDQKHQALDALIESITEASLDPVALHGPLRRLAVHLATELVRGELSQSSEAIGRLVETCLAEIDRAPGDHLVLAMHPDDLERWVQQPALALDRVELRGDPSIGPGSVRLSAGDTVIEDLIEHRLSVLATRVLGEAAAHRLPRLGALRARGFAEGDIADVG